MHSFYSMVICSAVIDLVFTSSDRESGRHLPLQEGGPCEINASSCWASRPTTGSWTGKIGSILINTFCTYECMLENCKLFKFKSKVDQLLYLYLFPFLYVAVVLLCIYILEWKACSVLVGVGLHLQPPLLPCFVCERKKKYKVRHRGSWLTEIWTFSNKHELKRTKHTVCVLAFILWWKACEMHQRVTVCM